MLSIASADCSLEEFEAGFKDYGSVVLDATDADMPFGIPDGESDEDGNPTVCFYSPEEAKEIYAQLGQAIADFESIVALGENSSE